MKEQIIVYYNKDKYSMNDYIVKRVLTQEEECYTINSYYMINNKLKCFPSKLKLSSKQVDNYLLQCKKASHFNKIEYQNIMEV